MKSKGRDLDELESERLDLGEDPVQGRLVGQRSCEHGVATIRA